MTSSASVSAKRAKRFLLFALFIAGLHAQGTHADAAAHSCAPLKQTIPAEVRYVYDGDTLELNNNQRVRLIGLNAPEVKRKRKPGEPLGDLARVALKQKVEGQSVLLEYDAQRRDRYKRQLAHVFLLDGTNLSAWLIRQGLADAYAFPPNLLHYPCYRKAEDEAFAARRGIWGHAYFAPQIPQVIADRDRTGFMHVRACVQGVKRPFRPVVLDLGANMVMKIYDDLRKDYLDGVIERLMNPAKRACFDIEGWVYNDKRFKQRAIRLYHADAIRFISSP